MKIGDLVKYMSRTILITGLVPLHKVQGEPGWVYGIECGETVVGMYRKSVLKAIKEDD
jgi:hypothetical protein